MHSAPLHVFSLGPIPVADTETTIFMGWHAGRLVPARARDADEALHELRATAPIGVPLICSPEIAVIGARHGFRNLPLPEEVRLARARLAFGLAHVDLAPPADAAIDALLKSAADFWAARPWERLAPDAPFDVIVTGAVSATFEAAIMGAGGEEFGVALYTGRGSVAKIIRAVDQGRHASTLGIDTLALTYELEPLFAVDAVATAYGCPRVPLTYRLKKGKARSVDASDTLALATVLGALTTMSGTPGEVGEHRLTSGESAVTATVRVPDPEAPVPRGGGRKRG